MNTKAALLWEPGKDWEIAEIELGDPAAGDGKKLRGVIHSTSADH